MRLLEAMIDANRRARSGDPKAGLRPDEFAQSLPLVILTCVDPRLNPLVPEVFGLPEDQVVWLRTAGNIITGSTSSTIRSISLACAVKGGKEIAVVGHTDCLVCKTSVVDLLGRLKAMGVDRWKLPADIHESFGLFASERQNVLKGVEFARTSPLIGPSMPIHGLMLDTHSGALEWLSNGYDAIGSAGAQASSRAGAEIGGGLTEIGGGWAGASPGDATLPAFTALGAAAPIGSEQVPIVKLSGNLEQTSHHAAVSADPDAHMESVAARESEEPEEADTPSIAETVADLLHMFDQARWYKVIGTDKKTYGPVPGAKLLQWITEGRVGWDTPAQAEGSGEWRPLKGWTIPKAVRTKLASVLRQKE